MDVKLQFPIDSNEDWSILVPGLDILVSMFTLRSLVKNFSFPYKLGNRFHDARIIFNEASVELCQSIESLNGLYNFWWRHIDQDLNFFWIWKFTGLADDVTKYNIRWYIKNAFVGVQTDTVLSATFKNEA